MSAADKIISIALGQDSFYVYRFENGKDVELMSFSQQESDKTWQVFLLSYFHDNENESKKTTDNNMTMEKIYEIATYHQMGFPPYPPEVCVGSSDKDDFFLKWNLNWEIFRDEFLIPREENAKRQSLTDPLIVLRNRGTGFRQYEYTYHHIDTKSVDEKMEKLQSELQIKFARQYST